MTLVTRTSDGAPTIAPLFHAVGCIAIWDERMLLLRRQGDRSNPFAWGLPGGKLDAGESATAAVIRELFEETGLLRSLANIEHVEDFFVQEAEYTFQYSVYATRFHSQPSISIHKDEHSACGWFTIHEAFGMRLVDGTIDCLQAALGYFPTIEQEALFEYDPPRLHLFEVAEAGAIPAGLESPMSWARANPVVLIGPPGAGKSTLIQRFRQSELGDRWDISQYSFARDRSSREHRYLRRYLAGDSSWAFICQIEALTSRYWQASQVQRDETLVDEWIYSTLGYSRALRLQHDLTEDEYQSFYYLYLALDAALSRPRLVLHLTASSSELLRRIQRRRRILEAESHTLGYLERLRRSFESVAVQIGQTTRVVTLDTSGRTPQDVLTWALSHIETGIQSEL